MLVFIKLTERDRVESDRSLMYTIHGVSCRSSII